MAEEFRIEIPIEVRNNANMGELQQLETLLNRIYASFQRDRNAAQGVFDTAASGAGRAAQSMGQVEQAANRTADGLEDVGNAAREAGADQQSAARNAAQATEHLSETVSEVSGAYDDIGDAAQQAGHESGNAFNQASNNVDRFTQRVEQSERSLRRAFGEKIQLIMEALDRASPTLRNISNTVKGLTAKAWHVAVKMTDMITAPFRKIKDLITSPIMMTLSVAGISMGAGSFVSTFTDFTAGMSNVKALSGATEEEFVKLTATAEQLGATTKFTATEAAEGMQYLAMAGWETSQIIEAMPGMLDLAAAGGTSLGTAADIVSDVMTAMGMSASQASTAADIFAKTATSTNTTIENLGETLKYAAPIAHSFGLQLSEVSAITGMMANSGIKGSQAGTAIRTSLLSMASPAKAAKDAMNKLGLSFADKSGKMKDMKTIIADLTKAFSGLSEQERLSYADDIFGKEASSAWLGIISQGADEYERLFKAIDGSAGAAKEMADTQLDNLAGDLTLLQSAADGMKVTLMKELNPYLRSAVQWITGKIPEITEKLSGMLRQGLEKAKELKEFVTGIFSSADFQNAEGFAGKFFVAWDKIIAEPFTDWWNGGGQQTILNAVSKLGKGLGDLYHGIISGIFAALKGEDIDFEGLNISGIAKAGAQAAKEFVTAFMSAFNLGGLFGEMPGMLKGGLLAFGGLKAGKTIFSLGKDLNAIKLAFRGVTTVAAPAATSVASVGASAATTAASAGSAVSVLGALKAGLAAIPVWGWVAAAALTAVTVGVVAYKNAQAEHRRELMTAGDEVRAAADQYVESAERVRNISDTIDEIKEVKIKISESKQENQNSIQRTKAELASVEDRIVWLEARLADTTLTAEDIKNYKAQLETIQSRKAEIEAALADDTLTPEQIETYQAELDTLNGKEVELKAALANGTLTKGDIEQYQAELDELKGKEVELRAIIANDSVTAGQVQEYALELSVLQGREEEIKMELEKGVTSAQAQEYMNELEILKGREELIVLKLEGLGVTTAGMLYAASLADSIDGKEAEVSVIMSQGSLTQDQIDGYVTELEKINTRQAEIELLQAGASLSPGDVKQYSDTLDGITSRTAEIEAKMAEGGLTEDEVKALSEKYSTLKTQEAAITIMLSGAGLQEDELAALSEEYKSLDTKSAVIYADLSSSGLEMADLEKISTIMSEIGDKQAQLTFEFSAGSLKSEDLEAYNQQLATLYGNLVELSGGQITQEDVDAGFVTEEREQQVEQTAALNASTELIELETELIKKRRLIPELVEERDKNAQEYNYDVGVQERLSNTRANLIQLDKERNKLVATHENLWESAITSGNWEEYDSWTNPQNKDGEIAQMMSIMERYNTGIAGANSADENGMAVLGTIGVLDQLWNDDVFTSRISDIQDAESRARNATTSQNAEYIAANDQLKGIYSGEVTYATESIFAGSDLADKGLEEIAKNYTTLDETGKKLFEDAVNALDALNAQTDYLAESDKTQAVDVVELAAKAEVMQQVQEKVQATADSYSEMDDNQKAAYVSSQEGKDALESINTALEAIGGQDISSLDDIGSALEQLKNADLSSFSLTDAQVAFTVLGGNASGAKTQVDNLLTALKNLDGTTATTTVTNNVYNNTINTTTTRAAMNANGGIYDGAMLSWVAEDGPEAIIPLGRKRRDRGIDLWLQAGEMLGVTEFADGGIMEPYGNVIAGLPDEAWSNDDDSGSATMPIGSANIGGGYELNISVEANPTYQIEGGETGDILDQLRGKQRELAEIFGGAIAEQLEDIVSNMV